MGATHSVFAVDIGSSSLKGVIAVPSSHEGKIKVVAQALVPVQGIRRGEIIESGEAAKALKILAEELKSLGGGEIGEIHKAVVNIGGGHVGVMQSRGVVTVSRADQMISEQDVERVLASSQTVSLPLNREVIHIIPKEFIVDGEGKIKDAAGMHGVRLELDALIVYAFSPQMKILERTFSEAGLGIGGMVISGLAGSTSILSQREKEIGSVLIDIGAQTTDVAVFEEGELLHLAVLPIGSFHISNDIAIGLRLAFDIAEELKMRHGHCDSELVSRRDVISAESLDVPGAFSVSRKELAEIIEARIEEIFELVNKELRKVGKEAMLPGGAVLVGGGAKTAGIVDFAKNALRLPSRAGHFENVEGLVGRLDPLLFANAVGLAKWALETNPAPKASAKSFARGAAEKLKKALRSFLP